MRPRRARVEIPLIMRVIPSLESVGTSFADGGTSVQLFAV